MVFTRTLLLWALLATTALALPARDRYKWIPDSKGKLHIVDLLEAEIREGKQDIKPRFNGETDVSLSLYTQSNPTIPQLIYASNDTTSPNFNSDNPTRIVIHGWTSNGQDLDDIRQAYIDTDLELNIVIVDWSGPAGDEYIVSKQNTLEVGDYIVGVIRYLVSKRNLNLDDVHIIGHSLGGQLAGVIGNRLDGQLAQIVGLDPALPLFITTPLENRLDSTDAKFVQVIHTNGGGLGWRDALGDIDFFPNGGTYQAGCSVDLIGICSHIRALYFFAESVTSEEFVATLCNSYLAYRLGLCRTNDHATMGEWTPTTLSGSFYLQTNSESPYAQGDVSL